MLSCVTVIVVVLYAGYKGATLIDLQEYKVQERLERDIYAQTDKFGTKDGFAFAMGVSDFVNDGDDRPVEPMDDPSIG